MSLGHPVYHYNIYKLVKLFERNVVSFNHLGNTLVPDTTQEPRVITLRLYNPFFSIFMIGADATIRELNCG